MTLAERLRAILDSLPADWSEARLVLTVADTAQADRAALILASLAPGRDGSTFRVSLTPTGQGGPSVDAVGRVLDRLESESIDARLGQPGTAAFRVGFTEAETPRSPLAVTWDELCSGLPADWSDVYLEVELASTDDIDRAALLLGPVNPFLVEGRRPAFRFRAARRVGYGAAPVMARRVLARLDEGGVHGTFRLLNVQSETRHALTQGPVWREGGRSI